MSYQYSLNQAPVNLHDIFYKLKVFLVAQGWVVVSSSDGSTYNSSGDQISSNGSGAGGIDNNYAWFQMRSPDSKVWFTYQRGTAKYAGRVKFSISAFNAGSPSATQTPAPTSAGDETIRMGSGTDASPSFTNHDTSDSNSVLNIIADNAAPYGVLMYGYTSTNNPRFCFYVDPLTNCSSNDTFPYAVACGYAASTVMTTAMISDGATTQGNPMTFYGVGEVWGDWVGVGYAELYTASGRAYPDGMAGTTADDPRRPIDLGRRVVRAVPHGFKGRSSLFQWPGVSRATRSTHHAAGLARSGNVVHPWDGATTPT